MKQLDALTIKRRYLKLTVQKSNNLQDQRQIQMNMDNISWPSTAGDYGKRTDWEEKFDPQWGKYYQNGDEPELIFDKEASYWGGAVYQYVLE